MTAVNLLWGPVSFGSEAYTDVVFADYYYELDDLNDAIAGVFVLPKSGTITKIGFYVAEVVGSPPNYKVGLTTISSGSSAAPEQTAYGGSSIDDYTPSTTGWKWITLNTPATAIAGELACVHVFPGTSIPNTSNYISISNLEIFYYVTPWYRRFTTGWLWGGGAIPMAIQYDDGTIAGLATTDTAVEEISSETSPDEVGDVFTLPVDLKVIGAAFWTSYQRSLEAIELNLYDEDDNVLGSCSIANCNTIGGGWFVVTLYFNEGEIQLYSDAVYRITIKATSAVAGVYDGWKFNSATDRQSITYPESSRWYKTERTDGGAWTDDDTSIMHMGLMVSDISGGTSGSGSSPGAVSYFGFIG